MGGSETPIQDTTGQTGRALIIVECVKKAYTKIQRMERRWFWLEDSFDGALTASVRAYSASDLGITERFGGWIFQGSDGYEETFSLRDTAIGYADEGFIRQVDWPVFRRNFKIGEELLRTGRPSYVSVSPQRKLEVHPVPDQSFNLRGTYYKSPQILAADGDIPEMPEHFHELIYYEALALLARHDEAYDLMVTYQRSAREMYTELRMDQAPRLRNTGEFE